MKIENLANLNTWWKFGKDFWKYDRNLKEVKEKFVEFKRRKIELEVGKIYVIRGIRQSGKTTYLKQTILNLLNENVSPNAILYLSCDRIASRKELSNVISNFIRTNRDMKRLYIFLDEITYLEGWNVELKTLADSNFIDKITVVATGSNPVKIKERVERLPGRRVEGNEYYFKPLTFREFVLQVIDKIVPMIESSEFSESLKRLKEKLQRISLTLEEFDIKKMNELAPFKDELDYLLEIYLLTGGFPMTINDYLDNKFLKKKEHITDDYYETLMRIVLGDISKIKRSEAIAKQIMRGIMERYCSRYGFTTLGKSIDLSHQTTIDYLDVLEDSFLVLVINSFDLSKRKPRMKADKKIYFSDNFMFHGIASLISGQDGFTLSKENSLKNKDKFIEAIVATHLVQAKEVPYLKEWKTYLWFFYTSTGKEIDFLYKRNDAFIGIEVKYKENVDMKEITKIEKIKNFVLTKNQLQEFDDMIFVPVSLFLSCLEKSEKII